MIENEISCGLIIFAGTSRYSQKYCKNKAACEYYFGDVVIKPYQECEKKKKEGKQIH